MTGPDRSQPTAAGAPYSELQLDALRELANIASGTAATSLSQLLAREVNLSVPRAFALSLADAVDAIGDPGAPMTGVALVVSGSIDGLVLLLIDPAGAATLCSLLGVDSDSDVGSSALSEVGNILGAGYLNALAAMTGLSLVPSPPQLVADAAASIVSSALALSVGHGSTALVLDSQLEITGAACAISFMLLPNDGYASRLLAPFGLAETAA